MKFPKKGLILILLVLVILTSVKYAAGVLCYLSSHPQHICTDEPLTDEECLIGLADQGGMIPLVSECDPGCCCAWGELDKKYQAKGLQTRGHCSTFGSYVFNEKLAEAGASCAAFCDDLNEFAEGDEGELPACMNGKDDDLNGAVDYPVIDSAWRVGDSGLWCCVCVIVRTGIQPARINCHAGFT